MQDVDIILHHAKLVPFQLNEVKEFFNYKGIQLPEIEVLKIYMAFGGIAEYLEHVQNGDSSVTAIDRICFQKGINTIMLTTWGIEGKHAIGLVTNSLTIDCLFS